MTATEFIPYGILVCSECGSERVQQKAWVDANDHKRVIDVVSSDAEDCWCEDCQGHHELIPKKA